MSILFYFQDDSSAAVEAHLRQQLPDTTIQVWPDLNEPEKIEYVIAWKPPSGFFDNLRNLKMIFSLGAGVDHLLDHPELPADVPIVRLVDAGMAEKMEEYMLYGVLHAHRRMTTLKLKQQRQDWFDTVQIPDAADFRVGILGLGALGQRVAARLSSNGYPVSGWARQPKPESAVPCHSGNDGLSSLVGSVDVLVCLLPLTAETTGILNQSLFQKTKRGVFLINAARGAHLVENDLLDALESGQVSGALLDVTAIEPLPDGHPFWTHPRIILTPHVAAPTQIKGTVEQIAKNYRRAVAGEDVVGLVDREGGY